MNPAFRFLRLNCFIFLIVIFSNCSPLIWPAAYHVPALKKQGDVHLSAQTGTSELNLQVAVMPVNHLMLTSAYNTNVNYKETGHVYNRNTFGIGYVRERNDMQLGFLAMYGFGKSRDNSMGEDSTTPVKQFTQVTYTDYQFQPYLNFFIADESELYAGIRGSIIRTRSFTTNETTRLSPGNTGTFEPFLGFRQGINRFKIEMQLGLYAHKNTYDEDGIGAFISKGESILNVHFGLGYSLNFKKRTAKK
jgi:hypothetical protein